MSTSGEKTLPAMLVMSTKHLVCLLALDLFFFLFSFSFFLAWHLARPKPLKSVALVISLVSSVWSFLRWQEVFSDLS
ncbi:hypothetical protein CNBD0100 [Cryptococcus deneoformans B-3501A]|uniref:Expressed protein n=1 Tax=Cryptococcus deneoformans (strain JEC21 / ATCC MYA-565) TaxID=214684 RepID=Q5KHI7_CRYD1|nr:expressed protein [Cryptococcus neoformans var. neoformans JEC21]XP_776189.1 hypothetical protein CNBD0100 [Cryptococcus neoformans var. neoformans B-3501A]AAW43245.1 expressed protein [Cryptococcus neoformans var. neoformans JEC21]EAL21542.1 hypothetical protein CNBD0100 [Cryptococcus neoformans var. neoformans B-3501A]